MSATTVRYLALLNESNGRVRIKRLEGVLIPHAVHIDEMILHTDDGESHPDARLFKSEREACFAVIERAQKTARKKQVEAKRACEIVENELLTAEKALRLLKEMAR